MPRGPAPQREPMGLCLSAAKYTDSTPKLSCGRGTCPANPLATVTCGSICLPRRSRSFFNLISLCVLRALRGDIFLLLQPAFSLRERLYRMSPLFRCRPPGLQTVCAFARGRKARGPYPLHYTFRNRSGLWLIRGAC